MQDKQSPKMRRANLTLAIGLGLLAMLIGAWPLYLMNQDGNTVVFRADDAGIEVLAENTLDEPTNATLAIAGGEIYLRTHQHLYCIVDGGAEAP